MTERFCWRGDASQHPASRNGATTARLIEIASVTASLNAFTEVPGRRRLGAIAPKKPTMMLFQGEEVDGAIGNLLLERIHALKRKDK